MATKGEKNLLKDFNKNESSKTPKNVFTRNEFSKKMKKAKKQSKPKQTSIRINVSDADRLLALENILRFNSIDETINYLINIKLGKLNSQQKMAFNAFKKVLDYKRK